MTKRIIAALLFFISLSAVAKPIKLTFWHAMSGPYGEVVKQLANNFNAKQSRYQVIPVYKGAYQEVITTTVAAFRAGVPPDMVQVFDVGTATMSQPRGAIIPVAELIKPAVVPAIARYYSDSNGQLQALPFNTSSAILFYNQAAFKKAGLDPKRPPKTWPEIIRMAKKLRAAGVDCAITSTWPSWILLEQFTAWHNLPFASPDNGFTKQQTTMAFTSEPTQRHLSRLRQMQRQGLFRYGGRADDAMSLFTSQTCAMVMQSSGAYIGLTRELDFPVEAAPLPYWPDFKGAPQNTTIGGAAIWVMARKPADHYPGVAAFLTYLLSDEAQLIWVKATGYMPVTQSAYQQLQQQGFYQKHPGASVAYQTIANKPATVNSRGIRLGNFTRIRQLNADALESIFSGQLSVKAALSKAKQKGDRLLEQFARNAMPDRP